MQSAVCTVAEGAYHFGVAALCNSLYRNGFRGRTFVFYRGDLPGWAGDATDAGPWRELVVADDFAVCFVLADGAWHLANGKPAFLRRVFDELLPTTDAVFYFDSDIVIECPWRFYEEWVGYGLALVQDMWDPYMYPTHIYKRRWRAQAERLGYNCRDVAGYFNSGFLGVRREDSEFLAVWDAIMQAIPVCGGDMRRIKLNDHTHPFNKMDQDAMNAAVLATTLEIANGSQEMMEIFPWAQIMSHAINFQKPWRRRYLWDALQGFPPGRPHLAYWRNVAGPIEPYSPAELKLKRIDVAAGRLIARLHHRSLLY
jgi:hypothetical protein